MALREKIREDLNTAVREKKDAEVLDKEIPPLGEDFDLPEE